MQRDGKWAEYAAYAQDVSAKLAKVRIDAGETAYYGLLQAVHPAGRYGPCDYRIVVGYDGFPPAPSGSEKTTADMKKARLGMAREAMLAKRDELSYLVSSEIWRKVQRIGDATKGG